MKSPARMQLLLNGTFHNRSQATDCPCHSKGIAGQKDALWCTRQSASPWRDLHATIRVASKRFTGTRALDCRSAGRDTEHAPQLEVDKRLRKELPRVVDALRETSQPSQSKAAELRMRFICANRISSFLALPTGLLESLSWPMRGCAQISH